MVESLKELNKICQKPHYKKVGNWMVRHILRDAALPVTWLLLHTPMTANQMTFLALLVGIGGAAALAGPATGHFVLGVLLLQLWYYLDHVDGQIARYRGTASLTGRFFDFMMHHLIHGVVLFAVGYYCFHAAQKEFYLIGGFVASVAIIFFNVMHDVKYKTYFEKLSKSEKPSLFRPRQAFENQSSAPQSSALKRIYSLCHKLCEMHVMMNIMTFAAFMESLLPFETPARFSLFWLYAVLAPFIYFTKMVYVIMTRKIDEEFESQFRDPSDRP